MKAIDLITQLKEEHAVIQNLIGFLFGITKANKTTQESQDSITDQNESMEQLRVKPKASSIFGFSIGPTLS